MKGVLTQTCEHGEYRLNIRYPDGTYSGGMSCGTVIEVEYWKCIDDEKLTHIPVWISTTIESGYNADGEEAWYLTGLYKAGDIPTGLIVRK